MSVQENDLNLFQMRCLVRRNAMEVQGKQSCLTFCASNLVKRLQSFTRGFILNLQGQYAGGEVEAIGYKNQSYHCTGEIHLNMKPEAQMCLFLHWDTMTAEARKTADKKHFSDPQMLGIAGEQVRAGSFWSVHLCMSMSQHKVCVITQTGATHL